MWPYQNGSAINQTKENGTTPNNSHARQKMCVKLQRGVSARVLPYYHLVYPQNDWNDVQQLNY